MGMDRKAFSVVPTPWSSFPHKVLIAPFLPFIERRLKIPWQAFSVFYYWCQCIFLTFWYLLCWLFDSKCLIGIVVRLNFSSFVWGTSTLIWERWVRNLLNKQVNVILFANILHPSCSCPWGRNDEKNHSWKECAHSLLLPAGAWKWGSKAIQKAKKWRVSLLAFFFLFVLRAGHLPLTPSGILKQALPHLDLWFKAGSLDQGSEAAAMSKTHSSQRMYKNVCQALTQRQ